MEKKIHEPVLLNEVLEALRFNTNNSPKIIDATLGAGGHTEALIDAGAVVLGIDADITMLERTAKMLEQKGYSSKSYQLEVGNFRDIDLIAKKHGFESVDGILLDLGISNVHLLSEERGFSFRFPDAKLDMRLSPETQAVDAGMLVNSLREDQLKEVFLLTMPFPDARRLAQRIIEARKTKAIETVGQFLEAARFGNTQDKNHPATQSFLALRIAVNSEYQTIEEVLRKGFDLLRVGGRLAVISFHSGEDRFIKEFGKLVEDQQVGLMITKKPIIPTETEINRNKKARSAKLRIIEKIK